MASSLTLIPFFLILFLLSSTAQPANDTAALAAFRAETDGDNNLLTNWSSSNACFWHGVNCNTDGRVTALSLPSLNLDGPITYLSHLSQLRLLNLHNNRLNGPILPITNCLNLKLLYLSKNNFSGEIPREIGALKRLLRIDLSNNNLRGSIPDEISKLKRVITVRLQNNGLSGQVPDVVVSLPKLRELNFSNNAGLCGLPLLPACSAQSQSVVPSNPSSLPATTRAIQSERPGGKLGSGSIAAIVGGNVTVLLVIIGAVVVIYMYRRRRSESRCVDREWAGERDVESGEDRNNNKLVFLEKEMAFELEELLRASAEMLGKGGLGTVYKAMLENGRTFAVKRLKDANACSKREFEYCMDLIWKIRHPNIVNLRAYYFAKEEKLLVYDYLHNGSLHSLLHGNRGPGRIPLDWTTRLSIVSGAAHGLARIHEESSNNNDAKICHGNVKSSNILVDKNGVACISDFGLALLLPPIEATSRLGGYRAPEQAQSRKLSQKADVYSFGVLLLEIVTGRDPLRSGCDGDDGEGGVGVDVAKWVGEEWTPEVFDTELMRYKGIEEEMVALLQVAVACVAEQPEKRPSMGEVGKMVEEIMRVVQSPLDESTSPSLAVTEDSRASC